MSSSINGRRLSISVMVIVIGFIACYTMKTDGQQGERIMAKKTIKEVLKEKTNELMSLPGVVGIAEGLCDDKPCIKVFVIEKKPELKEKISHILESYPVIIEETSEIRARP